MANSLSVKQEHANTLVFSYQNLDFLKVENNIRFSYPIGNLTVEEVEFHDTKMEQGVHCTWQISRGFDPSTLALFSCSLPLRPPTNLATKSSTPPPLSQNPQSAPHCITPGNKSLNQ